MKILIRFGELMLKGKNQKVFINKLIRHLKIKFKDLDLKVENRRTQAILEFNEEDLSIVEQRIMQVPGIFSYSIIYETSKDYDEIVKKAVELLKDKIKDNKYRFKVESRRTDKQYPLTSLEFSRKIAPDVLSHFDNQLIVDVKNPQLTLNLDIRHHSCYIFLDSKRALGGFPSQIAGKGLLMLSGGIDSPAAGFLALKQGVDVELIHFESTPLTPLESINKVIEISRKLAVFLPGNSIRLHVVPFLKIHETLLNKVTDSYVITIMRRMMYRIAEGYANRNNIDILINGEALGQVASQTLSSIKVVENVTNIPIIRPVATYDKLDIIKIAENIDTYNISIKPFNDCCSIYVPKNPVINPTISICEEEEARFEYGKLVEDAINNIKTIVVRAEEEIDLSLHGFTFLESYESLVNSK